MNKLGRPHIPNATYQVPRSSTFWFWRRRFLNGFFHIWAWRPSWSCDHNILHKFWLILLTVPRRYFFCGSFMFLFCLVFAMFCVCLFICALWSPAGKGLTSWLSFVVSTVSLSLSHWYPGSGVVLDCIDS